MKNMPPHLTVLIF